MSDIEYHKAIRELLTQFRKSLDKKFVPNKKQAIESFDLLIQKNHQFIQELSND